MAETKKEQEAAYRAGCKVLAITWPDSVPEQKRIPGIHLCPFGDDRPEQKKAWLRGLGDALESKVHYDPATILKEIHDEIKVASHAR